MNKVLVLVTLIVCGVAIIFGNLHWNEKISAQSEANEEQVELVEDVEKKQESADVIPYASNLPEGIQEEIRKALDSKEPVKIVIFGTSEIEGTWIDLFKKELIMAYGEGVFDITAISTGSDSTRDIVNKESYVGINELNPDILLFEAPMLKDNGNVGITNTLTNLEEIFKSWQAANEDLVLMIQPSQPLYNATFYPSEVRQLQDYTEKKHIIFLNHWENWPDLDNVEMKNYLTNDSEVNDSGFAVWADFLVEYFVAK